MGKKRSFVQCQKRNVKRGRFGRGVELDEETFSYFIRIMGEINHCKNDKKEGKDSLAILASNVFREIENNETNYSSNQVGSRVIEQLMEHTTDQEFFKFVEAFTSDIRPLCTDPYSSHVLQSSVLTAFKRYFSESSDPESKKSYFEYALRIGKFLLNNIDDFAVDMHANHIIRVVLSGVSGNPVNNLLDKLPKLQVSNVEIPDEFHELLTDYVNRVLSCPQFDNYCNDNLTSALVQNLLITTRMDFKLNKNLIKRILENFKAQPLDIENKSSESILRLLETVLTVADEKQFKKIYRHLFQGKLKMFACHKVGNFAVQKLLTNCKDKELFEEMYTDLVGVMGEILESRNAGVILSLARGCRECKIKQLHFVSELQKIFNCYEPESRKLQIIPLIGSLTSFDNYDPEKTETNYLGMQLIQELLHFNKPIKIIDSLLNMSNNELIKLLCDMKGCHITDSFVDSPFVGEKSRERLFKKLQGHFVDLAISKYGSRSLDAIWKVIPIKLKIVMLEELKTQQSQLMSNMYGSGFANRIHLQSFRKNKDSWVKSMSAANTAEKFIEDVIPKKKFKHDS